MQLWGAGGGVVACNHVKVPKVHTISIVRHRASRESLVNYVAH
jgi:hypothetical protein